MSILDRIISKLRDIVQGIAEAVGEAREAREDRRAVSLAEKLDELAKDKPYKNWRTSIEDLAYLVGEDGSFTGRTIIWSDLGFKGKYEGTAAQNIKMHARFLEDLPTHGIPWPKAAS